MVLRSPSLPLLFGASLPEGLPWPEWAWLLGVVGLLVGGALFLRWRVRDLRRHAARLEGKVQERTEALALRNRSLERLHHQLQKNLASRVQLMNTVLHDLRSPLTTIMISVDRMRAIEASGGNCVSTLNLVERECRRLEQILTKLLDQSRAENLEESLNLRLCRPSEMLQGLADTFRLRAEARDLSAQLDLDPAADRVWILADTTALQQVLFNLIENALKFTQPPGEVGLRSRVAEGAFHMEVWDTGRGIEPAKVEAIFQPFRQAAHEDSASGWGLGLSICSAMVKAHQGNLALESQVGRGSRFCVTIPLVLPRDG